MTSHDQGGEPLRWGIMGTARIARKLWKAILMSGNATLVAVASRSEDKAKQFISDCSAYAPHPHKPEAVGSYEALLERPDIEAVYIPLPTGIRKEWVLRAAGAGKHVLVEKPVGVTAKDVLEMVEACESHGVLFMDGVMMMHSALTDQIKDTLHVRRKLGAIHRIASHFSFRGSDDFLQGGDIRTVSTTEPLGCLGDLGWYCIRMTLVAMDLALPTRVRGTMHHASKAGGVPLSISGEMEFSTSGSDSSNLRVSATFFCSFEVGAAQWVSVACEQGSLYVDDFVLPTYGNDSAFTLKHQDLYDHGKCEVVVERMDQKVSTREICHGHATSQESAMIRNFSKQARELQAGSLTKASRDVWIRYALYTQQVLDAVLDSAAHQDGAWINLTPLR